MQGGVDPHGDAQYESHDGGHQGQFKGGGKALRDQARDFDPLAQAQPKLALNGVTQKMPELNEKGLVQAQVGAQGLNLIWRRVLTEQKNHRVAHILKQ